MKRLILLLGDVQEPVLWCWGDPSQTQYQLQGECLPGETLPNEVLGSSTLVLVPGQRVVLRTTQFQGPTRLAKAQSLAFQCEDELLEDVEELHWVILGQKGADYTLAGYRSSDMQQWLTRLASLGIQPTTVLPDILGFPYNEQPGTHVLRQHALFRNGEWSGYCLPRHWQLGVEEPLGVSQDTDTLWHCAATEFDNSVTLLKGKFSPCPPWRSGAFWLRWMPAAGLLLTLCALVFGGISYQQQAKLLQQQIAQIHAYTFSDGKIPPQPLVAIEKRIKILQHQQQPRFFTLGQQLRQALPAQSTAHARTLTFDADLAELTLTLDTVETTPFSHLNEQGNQVSLQKMPGENTVKLTVKEMP